MVGGVPNAPTVYHHATLGILIGLNVPTFATLVGRSRTTAVGSVLRSSAYVSIRGHMQVPQLTGYSIGQVGGRSTIAAVPTVLRSAQVSISPAGGVHESSQTVKRTTAAIAPRVTVTARPGAGTSGATGIHTAAGITGHARVVVSSADVIRMSAKVIATAFPVYAVQVRIDMGVKVVARSQVPQSLLSAGSHIGTGAHVTAGSTVSVRAAEHLQTGAVVVAIPQISRRTTVHMQTGLRVGAVARNLMGAAVGIVVIGAVHSNEGRGTYGRAVVGIRSGTTAYGTILARGVAGMQMGARVATGDTALRGGQITIEMAVRVLAGMIRTAQGIVGIQTSLTIQAAGDRNSLGGIQSTITPTNPKGTITQLGPTSTISVIP